MFKVRIFSCRILLEGCYKNNTALWKLNVHIFSIGGVILPLVSVFGLHFSLSYESHKSGEVVSTGKIYSAVFKVV